MRSIILRAFCGHTGYNDLSIVYVINSSFISIIFRVQYDIEQYYVAVYSGKGTHYLQKWKTVQRACIMLCYPGCWLSRSDTQLSNCNCRLSSRDSRLPDY